MTRREPVPHLNRATSAEAVELVGIKERRILPTASTKAPGPVTMSFTWKHPNYYAELRRKLKQSRLQAQAQAEVGDKHSLQANPGPTVPGSCPSEKAPRSENQDTDDTR
jgi:hypothetical protein